ncbi:MAG: sugar phosphate isomerase/epimerase [SAR324 cluster bacterium]|nr:sugar phosphate isomerase/epimerase [SAR324 cluster bacterium]
MIPEIYIQLYSLRNELEKEYSGIIKELANTGYCGVEPAGFRNCPAPEAALLFSDLGLKAETMHSPLPVGDDRNKILEEALAVGAKYLFTGVSPGREKDFESLDAIKRSAETYNEVGAVMKHSGISFGFHSHWWEMKLIDGVPAYQIFLEHTEPDILWEIDTYWVKVGGQDPVKVTREAGERAPVIHIKDGPCTMDDPMVAVGSGKMEIEAIFQSNPHIKIAVVELDRCATDMLDAVKDSYQFLVSKNFAKGKK